jgi:hypothetical protein
MNVASVEVCKELHALAGWESTSFFWQDDYYPDGSHLWNLYDDIELRRSSVVPAYDLGFLMRMLPGHYVQKLGNGSYIAKWTDYAPTQEQRDLGTNHLSGHSKSSPENALCRLAIELFQHGVLISQED